MKLGTIFILLSAPEFGIPERTVPFFPCSINIVKIEFDDIPKKETRFMGMCGHVCISHPSCKV